MQQPSVLYALGCFAAISTAHAVTSWGMDKTIYNAYHDDRRLLPLVCLLCGTFSGCMGGILCDWLGFLRSPSFTATATPGVFTSSAGRKTIINAFVSSVVYYLCMNPANYLPWSQGSRSIGHLIIAVIHLTHFISIKFSQLCMFAVTWWRLFWVVFWCQVLLSCSLQPPTQRRL